MVDRGSRKIRKMFGSIAPRYDRLNRILSLSVDRLWRRRTRRRLLPLLPPSPCLLDLCTGTGDLALELSRHGQVIGCDFCHEMLVEGARKIERRRMSHPVWLVEGDALKLPFEDARFDGVTIAFGLRNLEDYPSGLKEMCRVLKRDGVLAILEFSNPTIPLFAQLYRFYFKQILPRIGRLLSGEDGPYSYLPASVDEFPTPPQLSQMLLDAGFREAEYSSLSLGIAALHLASK